MWLKEPTCAICCDTVQVIASHNSWDSKLQLWGSGFRQIAGPWPWHNISGFRHQSDVSWGRRQDGHARGAHGGHVYHQEQLGEKHFGTLTLVMCWLVRDMLEDMPMSGNSWVRTLLDTLLELCSIMEVWTDFLFNTHMKRQEVMWKYGFM
jgi:hypothetical protein